MGILIIAAAALLGEFLLALLAGRLLDHASQSNDPADQAILRGWTPDDYKR